MKKLKVLSALLAAALVVAMLNPASFLLEARAADEGGSSSNSGLVINKTATANPDGGFDITLEAYATGSKVISSVNKDVPTDIVLVLDQSGSMQFCITCGERIGNGWGDHDSHTKTSYEEVTSVNNNTKYYIKDGDTYKQVQHCSGTHAVIFTCSGGAGWYTSNSLSDHTERNKITPKTTDNPDGRQFYTRETTSVPATSRLSALTAAVNTFINNVSAKANGLDGVAGTNDDVDHRIAVVGFASASTSYTNTELLSTQNVVNYSGATDDNYEDALVSVNGTDGSVNTRLTTAVSRLTADGDTYLEYGMEMANKIFAQHPVESNERQRVVVVFTDGYPAPDGSNDFKYSMADAAIGYAKVSKSTYNATVYTVGVFDTANPTADITTNFATSDGWNDYGNRNGLSDAQEATAANRYMHYVSSNYPEAASLNNGGNLNSNADPFHNGDSYYLSASDADTLNNIFQQISDQIENTTSSTTLNENAVIKDIIAPQFQLPDDATAGSITLETYACTGVDDSGNYTFSSQENATSLGETATVEGTEVSVTGFNFAENWCGTETDNGTTTAHGNKLVIKFNVKTKDCFLGGNDVYTNASAGVYENANATEPVMTFPRPTVNIPIGDVTVTATDKNVYLLGNLTADQIKSGATVKCGGVNLDLSKDDYGLESWQTEYVNITVTYTDASSNLITDLKDLKDDTTYTVSVSVAPKKPTPSQGTSVAAKTGTGTCNINVFKPELTFKDSDVYYGDNAPNNYDGNKTGEVWKHDDTLSTAVTMFGTAPSLTLAYNPVKGVENDKIATKEDIPVAVTVNIGQADVTSHTVFKHTDCSGKTCGKPTNGAFWLHVNTCTLTITKAAAQDTSIGADEYFVFTVYKDNAKYTEVTINGTGSVTISELPVGTYTITEDTSVAWRYDTPAYSGSVALSSISHAGTLTCTNTKTTNNWINDFTRVINTYGKTEGEIK